MKKTIIILLSIILLSITCSANQTDWDKLKLVDEIFLQMEKVNFYKELRRRYYNKNRRVDPIRDPYYAVLVMNVRKLGVILNYYEKRYQEDFSSKWKYEDWLKDNPKEVK